RRQHAAVQRRGQPPHVLALGGVRRAAAFHERTQVHRERDRVLAEHGVAAGVGTGGERVEAFVQRQRRGQLPASLQQPLEVANEGIGGTRHGGGGEVGGLAHGGRLPLCGRRVKVGTPS